MANFLQRVVGGLGRFLVRASGTLRDPALTSLFGGAPNEAGVAVNEQSALSFSRSGLRSIKLQPVARNCLVICTKMVSLGARLQPVTLCIDCCTFAQIPK